MGWPLFTLVMLNSKIINFESPNLITYLVEFDQDGEPYCASPLEPIPKGAQIAVTIDTSINRISKYKKKGFVDLSFLSSLENVRRLSFEGDDSNIELFVHKLDKVESLFYKAKRYKDLSFVLDNPNLISLHIEMPKEDVMARWGVKQRIFYLANDDCSEIDFTWFPNLRALWVVGNNKGLTGTELYPLKKLVHFYMFRNTSFHDFGFLAEQAELEILNFDMCSKLSAFPDMSKCEHLKYVHLETCNRLDDYGGLQHAPNLSHVAILRNKPVLYEQAACLANLKQLERILVSCKEREEPKFKALFGDKWMPVFNETWHHELDMSKYPV
jgi:hypothetical protein